MLADTGLDISRAGKWKAAQFRAAIDYMGSYFEVDLDSEAVARLLNLQDRPRAVASLSGEGGIYDWAASIAEFSLDFWKAEYGAEREFVLVSKSSTDPEAGLCKISKCFCPGGKCQEILGTALTDVLGGIGGGLIGGWIGSLIGAAATSSMFEVAWHCCRYPD